MAWVQSTSIRAPASSLLTTTKRSQSWRSKACAKVLPLGPAVRLGPLFILRGAMSDRIIELKNIKKSYGQVYALGGVDLHVDKAEVVGLVGDNGAGKSTIIKILAG